MFSTKTHHERTFVIFDVNKFKILKWNVFLILTRFGIFIIWNELRYLKFLELKKTGMLLAIEFLKYSDLRTVFDINTRTGLAIFYGLTKLKHVLWANLCSSFRFN